MLPFFPAYALTKGEYYQKIEAMVQAECPREFAVLGRLERPSKDAPLDFESWETFGQRQFWKRWTGSRAQEPLELIGSSSNTPEHRMFMARVSNGQVLKSSAERLLSFQDPEIWGNTIGGRIEYWSGFMQRYLASVDLFECLGNDMEPYAPIVCLAGLDDRFSVVWLVGEDDVDFDRLRSIQTDYEACKDVDSR